MLGKAALLLAFFMLAVQLEPISITTLDAAERLG